MGRVCDGDSSLLVLANGKKKALFHAEGKLPNDNDWFIKFVSSGRTDSLANLSISVKRWSGPIDFEDDDWIIDLTWTELVSEKLKTGISCRIGVSNILFITSSDKAGVDEEIEV